MKYLKDKGRNIIVRQTERKIVMSQQIVGLSSSKDKQVKVLNARGTRTYPIATVIYCYKKDLPTSISEGHLIYTTDTHELYVGTGKGIQRIQLADDTQEIVNLSELPDNYVTQQTLQEDYATRVITNGLDTRLTNLESNVAAAQASIASTNDALNSKANVSDSWTQEEIQEQFIDTAEFDAGLATKVPVQYQDLSKNQVLSNNNGIKLAVTNDSLNTYNEVQLNSDGIIITHDALGTTDRKDTQIVIGRNGIYYYKDEPDAITFEKVRRLNTNATEDEDKKLITKGSLVSMVNEAIEAKHYVNENTLTEYAKKEYVDNNYVRIVPNTP